MSDDHSASRRVDVLQEEAPHLIATTANDLEIGPNVSEPLLHVAAFWCIGDHGEEIVDACKRLKIKGSKGAVVTFSTTTADDPGFRRTMRSLDLAEVNIRLKGDAS